MQSGVPILEGLNITKETCGNALFERIFERVSEAIREGETIAKPIKENATAGFHPVALGLWILLFAGPVAPMILLPSMAGMGFSMVGAAAMMGGAVVFHADEASGGRRPGREHDRRG